MSRSPVETVAAAKVRASILAQKEVEQIQKENKELSMKVKSYENDDHLVDWYIQYMESGRCSKTLLHQFRTL